MEIIFFPSYVHLWNITQCISLPRIRNTILIIAKQKWILPPIYALITLTTLFLKAVILPILCT